MRIDNERMAKSWRHLARSYQFVESLERFLLDSDKARSARPPEAPIEAEIIPLFPPPGAKFDPAAIAVLIAAFQRAIEGQSPTVHEIIARHIIELAFQGERDLKRPRLVMGKCLPARLEQEYHSSQVEVRGKSTMKMNPAATSGSS